MPRNRTTIEAAAGRSVQKEWDGELGEDRSHIVLAAALKLPSVATSNELLHGRGIVADTEVWADTIVQSTGHLRDERRST